MEDYITVSAKTLDDAITEALVQLGVTTVNLNNDEVYFLLSKLKDNGYPKKTVLEAVEEVFGS